MTFTAADKLAAVEQELRFRRDAYARRVEAKRMTQVQADREIAVFESIRDDYAALAERECLPADWMPRAPIKRGITYMTPLPPGCNNS